MGGTLRVAHCCFLPSCRQVGQRAIVATAGGVPKVEVANLPRRCGGWAVRGWTHKERIAW